MANSKIVVEFFLPTTSNSRIGDCTQAIFDIVKAQRGEGFFSTISGPYEAAAQRVQNESGRLEHVGSAGGSRSTEAREAFQGRQGSGGTAGAASERGGREPGTGTGSADDDGQPAKRGRGRPRKEGPGSAPARSERDDASTGRAQGIERPEPVGTRQGSDEGPGEGQGRGRSSGGSRDDQRGDRQAARVIRPDDEDWGDGDDAAASDDAPEWGGDDEPVLDVTDFPEDWHAKDPSTDLWPEALMPNGLTKEKINQGHLNTLMGEHFKAQGGKDRRKTFDLLAPFGAQNLSQIDPQDHWKLARIVVKDTMRYVHGVKK
jgi:hypothetical protein